MKNVLVTPNPYRDRDFQTARRAMEILRQAGMQPKLCLPFEVDRSIALPKDLHFCRLERELPTTEAVVCFGGDGTILHMAKAATRRGVPLLGVNMGTLGFMAELECTELDKLAALGTGNYTVESRRMLDVTVQRDSVILFHDIALNDIVITKGAVARVVYLSICCDGVRAMEFCGDGVIIATPSGSTAYSLSAGGPIVEPEAENILITPVCPHDMRSRCIVASDRRVITVELANAVHRNAFLSADGGKAFRLNMGDVAIVRRSRLETRLLRLKKRSFYDVVSAKLQNG